MKKRTVPELLPAGAGYGKQYWLDAAAQFKDIKILVAELKKQWNEIPEDLKPEWLTKEEVEGFWKRANEL